MVWSFLKFSNPGDSCVCLVYNDIDILLRGERLNIRISDKKVVNLTLDGILQLSLGSVCIHTSDNISMFNMWKAIMKSKQVVEIKIDVEYWGHACEIIRKMHYHPTGLVVQRDDTYPHLIEPIGKDLRGIALCEEFVQADRYDRLFLTFMRHRRHLPYVVFSLNVPQKKQMLALMQCKTKAGERSAISKLPVELFRMLRPFLFDCGSVIRNIVPTPVVYDNPSVKEQSISIEPSVYSFVSSLIVLLMVILATNLAARVGNSLWQ